MNKKNLYLIIGGAVLAIAIVVALIFGLGGNKTETPNGDVTNPTVNNVVENTTGEDIGETKPGETDEVQDETESVEPGDTVVIPDDAKDGDVLEDGTTYFNAVEVADEGDVTELLDKYAHELNKNLVLFTTPEYTGRVERLDNEYIIKKESDKFESVVFIYGENTSTNLTEFDENGNVKYEYTHATDEEVYTKKYYSENHVRVEQFKNDGSDEIYGLAEFERGIINGNEYSVLVRAEYMNNVHTFEYSDKINGTLSSMTVVEGGDCTYTFIMDGSGNNSDNVVSLTMTKNGKTTKYDSENIPWYSVTSPPGLMQSFSY